MIFIPVVSAASPDVSTGAATVVTGLQFEDVDIFWTSTGATLSNSYTNIDLSAKQILFLMNSRI